MARIELNHKSARSVISNPKHIKRSEDDEDYYPEAVFPHSIGVIEEDQPEPVMTGILDSWGNPIYRIPVDKPPIGFITPPEFQELFNHDTQTDYYYSTD